MRRAVTWRGLLAVLAVVAGRSAIASAADRPYDAEVKRVIGNANKGVVAFRKHASNAFKKSMTGMDGHEQNIGHLLDDLQDVGLKLEKRYASEYAAVPDAVSFLRRSRITDDFITQHRGLSGADSEWELARPSFVSLGLAYAVDWASDMASWKPVRAPDAILRRAAADYEKQARTFAKTLDAAVRRASLDSTRSRTLAEEAVSTVSAAATLRQTIDAGRPPGAALKGATASFLHLEKRLGSEGLAEAVSGSWRQLDSAMRLLSRFLGAALRA